MNLLYGLGSQAVFPHHARQPSFVYDLFFAGVFHEQWVVQKFLPAVKDGDKRIILVDGASARPCDPRPGKRRLALQHGTRRYAGGN